MSKIDLSKFLYTPPPADPLAGPRGKAVEFLDEAIAAFKGGKDFERGYKDFGDYYEVKVRSGNKLVGKFDVAKDKMGDFLLFVREQVASKAADDWFSDGAPAATTARSTGKRAPRTPEQRAAASEAAKKRWAKVKAEPKK